MNTYYKIFKISLANQLEYRANFISGFLFSLVPFTVNVLLWLAVTDQSSTIPLEASGIVSYYFLTLITYNITSTTSVFKISDDIRHGSLNQYLIKPYNYTLYQLAVDLPYRFVFIVMNALPITVLYFVLHGYFSRVSSLYTSIRVLKNISAGIIFPLVLLPKPVFVLLKHTPFVFISHIPVSLLLDTMPIRTVLLSLCQACGWIAALALLSVIVWKKGLRIYSAYGG